MAGSKYQIKMLGNTKSFDSCNEDHILNCMAKGGVSLAPNGCHGGGCGVCKIKILDGEIETLSMSKKYITEDEKKSGFVLACRAIPKSDVEFEFIGKPQCKRVEEKKKYGFV